MSRDDLEAQRALFEAFLKNNGFPTSGEMDRNGFQYDSVTARAYWIGWQAAFAAQSLVQGEPVGEVLGVWHRHDQAVISVRDSLACRVGQMLYASPTAQAPVQGKPVASDAEDSARLDWLEVMGNEREGILLHDGGDFTGRRGLGLRRIGRTVRTAIDAARKEGT